MAAITEKRPPKASRREKSTKEKTLESGSRFLPSVSRKQLVRSIREEKRSRRTGSDAGVPAQERRMQHQEHLQNHGPALLHDTRLAVAHAGWRYPLQARQGTGPTRVQDPQKGIQGSQALGEEGAERFQIRVRFMAAEPAA